MVEIQPKNTPKRACIVHVPATKSQVPGVRAHLEANGYEVIVVEANLTDAQAAEAGEAPAHLAACLAQADLCVFLLPESAADDAGLGVAGTIADQAEKRVIVVAPAAREDLPTALEDHASSVVRADDEALGRAIRGEEGWEGSDRKPLARKDTTHVKCQ